MSLSRVETNDIKRYLINGEFGKTIDFYKKYKSKQEALRKFIGDHYAVADSYSAAPKEARGKRRLDGQNNENRTFLEELTEKGAKLTLLRKAILNSHVRHYLYYIQFKVLVDWYASNTISDNDEKSIRDQIAF